MVIKCNSVGNGLHTERYQEAEDRLLIRQGFRVCSSNRYEKFYSGIKQGEVAAAGVSVLAKRPNELGKTITSAALVETYAILAALISLLLIL